MQRNCEACGRSYEAKRKTSRYCSSLCRTRVSRAGGGKPQITAVPSPKTGENADRSDHDQTQPLAGFAATVERELREAGRLDTVLGQLALDLAERTFSRHNTGAMVASMSKEFRTVMAAAMEGAKVEKDPIDLLQEEWRRRLEQRRSAG